MSFWYGVARRILPPICPDISLDLLELTARKEIIPDPEGPGKGIRSNARLGYKRQPWCFSMCPKSS
jgi:hypothetical protein